MDDAGLHRRLREDSQDGLGEPLQAIATAIGVQAVEHLRKKVRFFSTVELVNALE